MGILTRSADLVYTLRFLRLLTTPWEETGAYKLGIIDEDGKKIKKPTTSAEKEVYNTFHRLVFSIKRLINKIPAYVQSYCYRELLGLSNEFSA